MIKFISMSFMVVSFTTFFVAVSAFSQEKDVTNAELVQALRNTFGKHEGKRASHAKGLCYTGYFKASDNASDYSKASIFKKQSNVIPVAGRFSFAGGNPKVSDKARHVRGLAARLSVSANEQVDFVFLSSPIFFASTLKEFVGFLGARIPDSVTHKPNPDKVKAFAAANPKTTKQAKWLETHPIPSSYSATSYFGVHAFKLTNKKGKSQWIKWEFVPTKGERSLTDDEIKSKPDDFYRDQLQSELNAGEVGFDLYAVLGQDGDNLTDATEMWPTERQKVKMGTLVVKNITDQACDGDMFFPTKLVEGIEPSDDPILKARHPAYIISLMERQK